LGIGALLHLHLLLDERGQPLARDQRARQVEEQEAELLEVSIDVAEIGDEHHQRAGQDVALQGVARAEPQHAGGAERDQELDEPAVRALQPERAQLGLEALGVPLGEALVLGRLAPVGLHQRHGLDVVGDHGRDLGLVGAPLPHRALRAAAEVSGEEPHERRGAERHQAQSPVEHQHQHRVEDHAAHALDDVLRQVDEQVLHHLAVGREQVHHVAGVGALVEGERHLLQVLEHALADVGRDAIAGARGVVLVDVANSASATVMTTIASANSSRSPSGSARAIRSAPPAGR
jgi:hypothetical protein